MARSIGFRTLLVVFGLSLAAPAMAAGDARYVGALADGSRLEGKDIQGWGAPGNAPKLDGKDLLDPKNPLAWLIDQSLRPYDPALDTSGFLEFTNGDRLPGRVIAYEEAKASPLAADQAHLVVILKDAAGPAGAAVAAKLRVLPRFVRRIVWAKGASRSLEPGTLFFQDGRRLAFQGVRWQRDSIRVLLEEGVRQVFLTEVAEIHLPRSDAWQSYCDELAMVNPECTSRMVRLETTRGLVVSTAASICQPTGGGDRQGWYHVVQPAWSLDALWVHFPTIRGRWHFAADTWPLSRIYPSRFVEHPLLGKSWSWQTNRNVEGQPMQNATGLHGWGFGVHGASELWFELPRGVQAFRGAVGLDSLAGDGGSARGAVYVDRCEGTPLFQSPPLVGSKTASPIATIPLGGPARGQKYLILASDALGSNPPPGADPLDIRDVVNWIEPVLQLDASRLKADVQKSLRATVPAWSGWGVAIAGEGPLSGLARLESADGGMTMRRGVTPSGRSITLSSQRELDDDDGWLVVRMRPMAQTDNKHGRCEVRADGKPIVRFETPYRDESKAFCIPMRKFEGKKVKLELVYQPADDKECIDWQGIGFSDRTRQSLWRPLPVVGVRSLAGSTLTLDNDGSILASGPILPSDCYVISAECDVADLNAIRCEAIPDDTLPRNGPGRGPNGSFQVTRVSLATTTAREPIRGRYVRVERSKVGKKAGPPLALDEVQIYSGGNNIGPDGKATQSSTDGRAAAKNAIDNAAQGKDKAAAFARTKTDDEDPWWQVDLGGVKPLERVVVWSHFDDSSHAPNVYHLKVLDDKQKTVWERLVDSSRLHGQPTPCDEILLADSQDIPLRWIDLRRSTPPDPNAKPQKPPAWNSGRPGVSNSVAYATEQTLDARGKTLLISLEQFGASSKLLGRIRLSITNEKPPFAPDPIGVELPLLPEDAK